MELFVGSFDQFVDQLVDWGETTQLIVCNIDEELSVPSTFKRSSVRYLYNSKLIEVLNIDTPQKLLVYLAKLQVDQLEMRKSGGENIIPKIISLWNPFDSNLICSKLCKFEKVYIGVSQGTDTHVFEKWINPSS